MVEVGRIARAVSRWGDAFLARIYTPLEIERARRGKGRNQYLAARFAAKEAVMKALGTGRRQLSWREIEITGDRVGKPIVRLHGSAKQVAERQGVGAVLLALSHTHEHALASAVALGDPPAGAPHGGAGGSR